jgi:hypothetical protein
MSADAPRPVPPYGNNVSSQWWYCLYCRHAQPTEYQIVTHVKHVHYNDPTTTVIHGEDYTNGMHLRVMRRRWEEWSMLAIDRFSNHVASLRGADDFELEVGDGIPE